MLTDELCCVSLSVPEGEKDRTGMLENVCECVSVFNMSISRCARHVYQECSEKNWGKLLIGCSVLDVVYSNPCVK